MGAGVNDLYLSYVCTGKESPSLINTRDGYRKLGHLNMSCLTYYRSAESIACFCCAIASLQPSALSQHFIRATAITGGLLLQAHNEGFWGPSQIEQALLVSWLFESHDSVEAPVDVSCCYDKCKHQSS